MMFTSLQKLKACKLKKLCSLKSLLVNILIESVERRVHRDTSEANRKGIKHLSDCCVPEN